jgi:dihydroorotase-like cyclic amidohydrolase
MTFAELTGAATYIVHLSCQEALATAVAARQRGVRVAVETLIQYLLLDKTYAERPNFEGAKYVMSPPLRDAKNQSVLWDGLRDGLIQTVATDHAPFDFAKQVTYETTETLMPGETITTTCTFSEPKCAGQSTSQEMCYLFTYAYPKHALVDNGPEGTFMHGEGVCLGQ